MIFRVLPHRGPVANRCMIAVLQPEFIYLTWSPSASKCRLRYLRFLRKRSLVSRALTMCTMLPNLKSHLMDSRERFWRWLYVLISQPLSKIPLSIYTHHHNYQTRTASALSFRSTTRVDIVSYTYCTTKISYGPITFPTSSVVKLFLFSKLKALTRVISLTVITHHFYAQSSTSTVLVQRW